SWLLATVVVAMEAAAVAAPAAEILCGETIVGLLASGPDDVAFHARAGEVVSTTVVPLLPVAGFDPEWRISDVQGHPIALSNGARRCGGRCESAPLPGGETFSIRVTDSGVGAGAYVLSFEAVSATADGASNGPPTPTCLRGPTDQPDGTRAIAAGATLDGI